MARMDGQVKGGGQQGGGQQDGGQQFCGIEGDVLFKYETQHSHIHHIHSIQDIFFLNQKSLPHS